jgi:hypothetical protein
LFHQLRLRQNCFVGVIGMFRAYLSHSISPRLRYILGAVVFAVADSSGIGARMPRYLSQHTLACLTRQGAEELSKKILGAKSVTGRRVLVNMQEGKMLAEFDAPSREEMEKWLTTEKFHFDWLLRLEYESATDAALRLIS